MRLTMTNASAIHDVVLGLGDIAAEIETAAEGFMDLDGERGENAREQRADHRSTWEDNIDDLESKAVELAEAFEYIVLSVKDAKKLGWKPPTRG